MLEDYFSLQLKFAAHYAEKSGIPIDVAVDRCTNLRRRLNLWGEVGEIRWNSFLAQVKSMGNDHLAQLALCAEYRWPHSYIELGRSFGCFSYDPPDVSGTLRIHFFPPNGINSSPLAFENIGARVSELRDLLAHVQRTEPTVSTVRGVSWLYNIDAYRRLFPPAYITSVQAVRFPLHLNGSSTWGQVLNWRQEIKTAVRDQLLARLDDMRVKTPWEIFPFQAKLATSPIDVFYEHFS